MHVHTEIQGLILQHKVYTYMIAYSSAQLLIG